MEKTNSVPILKAADSGYYVPVPVTVVRNFYLYRYSTSVDAVLGNYVLLKFDTTNPRAKFILSLRAITRIQV